MTANVDGDTAETSARILMAEPVDLASPDTAVSGAPGTTIGLPTQVRNIGDNTVSGTVLTLEPLDIDLLGYGAATSATARTSSSSSSACSTRTFRRAPPTGRRRTSRTASVPMRVPAR